MENIVYKDYLEKNGRKISKVRLLYVDDNNKLCDCCDEMKPCASIQAISTEHNPGDVSVICKDCLQKIINEF